MKKREMPKMTKKDTPVDSCEPWVKIDLPSGYKPYGELTECFIRPLKTGEVKRLKTVLETNDSAALLDILQAVIRPIEAKDLTTGDFWYILAWLRENTFKKTPLIVPWICPKCGTKNASTYKLDEENITELPANYVEPVYLTLPSGNEVPLRFPRIGDSIIWKKYLKTLLNKVNFSPEETYIPELAMMIANDKSLHANCEMLEGFDPEDLLEIENFVDAFSHGLKATVTDTCGKKECGYEYDHIRFFFRITDIIPTNQSSERVRNAVRFGRSAASAED